MKRKCEFSLNNDFVILFQFEYRDEGNGKNSICNISYDNANSKINLEGGATLRRVVRTIMLGYHRQRTREQNQRLKEEGTVLCEHLES